MSFTVVILGRPNVGKSTLFNRLAGKRLALVDDTPGVTRDRREGEAHLGPLSFRVVDTAGLDETPGDTIEGRMRRQTEAALADADVALLLIDARAGLTPLDSHFARWLRGRDASVILVANKCEGAAGEAGIAEAYRLGLGDPVAISAEHGEGLADLYEALAPFAVGEEEAAADDGAAAGDEILQLAIVGRPNSGKSTLINRLLGEQRLLTGPEPGLTRDSIAVDWSFRGQRVRLVDTAGQRRRAKVQDRLERLSTADARRATAYAQVVALLVDATQPLEKQDLTIARQVAEEGRALVIVANKWDLVSRRRAAAAALRERVELSLPQLRGLPVITLSALTGKGVETLLPAVLKVYRQWNTRVATAGLNRWLDETVARHPPPATRGRPVRLRYITQAKARPPTFVLFASRPGELPESYRRYLVNGLRESFGLDGVPIRLSFRKGKNPYAAT